MTTTQAVEAIGQTQPDVVGLAFRWVAIAQTTAASITFSFTGTVTNVGNSLGTTIFSSSTTLSGSYTFNAADGG